MGSGEGSERRKVCRDKDTCHTLLRSAVNQCVNIYSSAREVYLVHTFPGTNLSRSPCSVAVAVAGAGAGDDRPDCQTCPERIRIERRQGRVATP